MLTRVPDHKRDKSAELAADVEAWLQRGGRIEKKTAFDNVEYLKTTRKGKPHRPMRVNPARS